MVKKYITRLKNRQGFVALLILLVVAAIGTGVAATIMQTKPKPNSVAKQSKHAEVAVDQSIQSVNQGLTPTTNNAADTSQPASTSTSASAPTRTTTDSSSKPVTSKVSTTATPPASSPSLAPTPAPSIDLTLGTLTFDDFTAPPTVTFTPPVTASANGNVTMVVMEQDDNAPLCTKTLDLSANVMTNVTCNYSMSAAPHLVNATVTTATTSVESSNVYIG